MKKYVIHTDGGSRGNPGHAGVGIIIDEIKRDGIVTRIDAYGEYIGIATNNVAEYSAVISALKRLKILHASIHQDAEYSFYLDSLLVVSQLNGVYKIKDATLLTLVVSIRVLEKELEGHFRYTAIRREGNSDADRQVNVALDKKILQ